MQKGSKQAETRARVQGYYPDASCIMPKGSKREEARVAICIFYEDSKLQKRLNVYKMNQRLQIKNTKNYKNTKRTSYGKTSNTLLLSKNTFCKLCALVLFFCFGKLWYKFSMSLAPGVLDHSKVIHNSTNIPFLYPSLRQSRGQ